MEPYRSPSASSFSSSQSAGVPHGGGLDTYGCHNNRKAGGYHCQRGPLAGQSFSSKEEMLKKLSSENTDSKVQADVKKKSEIADQEKEAADSEEAAYKKA